MKTIQVNDLQKYRFASHIRAGMCGYHCKNGGYIYASEGHGNIEDYLDMEDLITTLEYDGMTSYDEVKINVDNNGDIIYMHLDVWPM